MGRPSANIQSPPQVGDTLRVRAAAGRRDSGSAGVVMRLRMRDGRWSSAELEIAGQRRWFLKGELELPAPPPPPQLPPPQLPPSQLPPPSSSPPAPRAPLSLHLRRVGPPTDFLRIARRVRQGRQIPDLFIYIGRVLLEHWQAAAGPVTRVDVALDGARLIIRAAPAGRYMLDASAGRQPNIHCNGALATVTLPDGRYDAAVEGVALVVGDARAS